MMKTICDIKTSWKLTVLIEDHQNCFYRFPESVCLKCNRAFWKPIGYAVRRIR